MVNYKLEIIKIVSILIVAVVLLNFVDPGLIESPYNEF